MFRLSVKEKSQKYRTDDATWDLQAPDRIPYFKLDCRRRRRCAFKISRPGSTDRVKWAIISFAQCISIITSAFTRASHTRFILWLYAQCVFHFQRVHTRGTHTGDVRLLRVSSEMANAKWVGEFQHCALIGHWSSSGWSTRGVHI